MEIMETAQKPSQMEDETATATTSSSENVDAEEEEIFFQDIEMLLEQNVAVEDIERLKTIGINTVKGFQMTMKKKLLQLPGFDEEKVTKIKEACSRVVFNTGFMTALDVCDQRKQIFKLSTGSTKLNELLGGGIESMAITEVFGEFGTGKTQLSHTICVTAQLPGPNGYFGGKVIFIDTENTFRPERIRQIAERFKLDQNDVLKNILYARAYNSEHQFELLNSVASKLHEEAGIFKLLIIDSIMALFRVDYCGGGEMANRQQSLGQMVSRLQKISEEFNISIFITNQIASDFTTTASDIPKPVGGNVLAHASTTRLALKKASGNKRIAKIYDSPNLEENEVVFAITMGGIGDVED